VIINGSPLLDSSGKYIGSVGMNTDITEEKNLRGQLEDYARRLIQIQEEERKRVARELHDDTDPTLSYLSLEVDAIMTKFPHLSEETIKHLRDLREKINSVQEDIRRFSH
jgi:two-component system, NarL family, sensor histidine kinase NreB